MKNSGSTISYILVQSFEKFSLQLFISEFLKSGLLLCGRTFLIASSKNKYLSMEVESFMHICLPYYCSGCRPIRQEFCD